VQFERFIGLSMSRPATAMLTTLGGGCHGSDGSRARSSLLRIADQLHAELQLVSHWQTLYSRRKNRTASQNLVQLSHALGWRVKLDRRKLLGGARPASGDQPDCQPAFDSVAGRIVCQQHCGHRLVNAFPRTGSEEVASDLKIKTRAP
jgi:hypothetical protein